MKRLLVLFIFCFFPIFGTKYQVNRHFETFSANVEPKVNEIKKNPKNKNIKVEQIFDTDSFDITWTEEVEINI